MNGSPTWKITKFISGKFAAAPSMSHVCVTSMGCGPILVDLHLHLLQGLASLKRVDRAPEDRSVGVLVAQLCAALPGGEAVVKEVSEGEGHGDEHVRVGLVEDHASYLRCAPLLEELLLRELRLALGREDVVESIEVVDELLAWLTQGVGRVEVERVRYAVEDQHVVLDHALSPLNRASRKGASFSSGSLSFSRAPALILSGVHVGSHTTSTSTALTSGSLPTSSLIISKRRAANGHQPLVSTNSILTLPPWISTLSMSPMSTTLIFRSRQHGS